MLKRTWCTIVIACITGLCNSNEEKLSKMTFSMPKLTEEETESNYLPHDLKCDACTAVAYQIKTVLKRREQRSKNKILTESEVVDALENVCDEGFENYGLKEVDGQHRLNGPGLNSNTPGLVQMGGKWPRRIRDLCLVQVEDIGEMEIYTTFRKNSNLKKILCNKYCINKSKEEL